jgi:hypothetical protein
MSKRGKVLRDTNSGPGLLIVEGQQYPFTLDGVWRSAEPPKAGMTVDVEFDVLGAIRGIDAVPDSQLAKEQAGVALAAAKEKGAAVASTVIAKIGVPDLVAFGLIIIAWFFLTAVSVDIPFAGKMTFTFWQMLGFLNTDNLLDVLQSNGHPSAGFYGFCAVVCLVGPLVYHFWKDKRAVLGGILPLLFMTIIGLMVRSSINKMMGGAASGPLGDLQQEAQSEMMKAISIGFGIWLSVLGSLYFAGMAVKKFLAAKATA